MIIRSLLSGTPFVLPFLLAPDTGAPSGGGSSLTSRRGVGPSGPEPDVRPPTSESCPEPQGDTVEAKLESAKNIIRDLFGRVGQIREKT
jgi:hypothetical protein